MHLKTIYMQLKIIKYRNMQCMSKNNNICKVKFYILDLLAIIQTFSLPT